jgi:hypothetical protein
MIAPWNVREGDNFVESLAPGSAQTARQFVAALQIGGGGECVGRSWSMRFKYICDDGVESSLATSSCSDRYSSSGSTASMSLATDSSSGTLVFRNPLTLCGCQVQLTANATFVVTVNSGVDLARDLCPFTLTMRPLCAVPGPPRGQVSPERTSECLCPPDRGGSYCELPVDLLTANGADRLDEPLFSQIVTVGRDSSRPLRVSIDDLAAAYGARRVAAGNTSIATKPDLVVDVSPVGSTCGTLGLTASRSCSNLTQASSTCRAASTINTAGSNVRLSGNASLGLSGSVEIIFFFVVCFFFFFFAFFLHFFAFFCIFCIFLHFFFVLLLTCFLTNFQTRLF